MKSLSRLVSFFLAACLVAGCVSQTVWQKPPPEAAQAPRPDSRFAPLEAAIAAGDAPAAQAARDWLGSSGFEDARLRRLGQESALVTRR